MVNESPKRVTLDPKRKIRRDLLLHATDPMHARLTGLVMRRCAPPVLTGDRYVLVTHLHDDAGEAQRLARSGAAACRAEALHDRA